MTTAETTTASCSQQLHEATHDNGTIGTGRPHSLLDINRCVGCQSYVELVKRRGAAESSMDLLLVLEYSSSTLY